MEHSESPSAVSPHIEDLTALRDAFDRLGHHARGGRAGRKLSERFDLHPLQVLKEYGVSVEALAGAPDLWQTLHAYLSSDRVALPQARAMDEAPKDEREARKRAPSPEDEVEASEPAEVEGGFPCWACRGSAAVAICLAAAGVADHLRGVDSDTQQSLASMAPALALLLGVSTAAAAHEAALAFAQTDDLDGFVSHLVDRACAHVC